MAALPRLARPKSLAGGARALSDQRSNVAWVTAEWPALPHSFEALYSQVQQMQRREEENMQHILRLTSAAILTTAVACGAALAQDFNDEPLQDKWAPTEWGPDDRVGAPNRTKPEMVLKALGLVKKGKVATLGKVKAADLPTVGTRRWNLMIPQTGSPTGAQKLVGNVEYVAAELGQVGTQFDGPGHIGINTSKGKFFYNGRFMGDKGIGASGLGPLGVEHVAEVGFVCRGVLLDAVALRGAHLPGPKATSASDPGIITAKAT